MNRLIADVLAFSRLGRKPMAAEAIDMARRDLTGCQGVVQHRQLVTQRAAGGDDSHVA